jgi:hypothetical protein
MTSSNNLALMGEYSLGFNTIVHPAARAGMSFTTT